MLTQKRQNFYKKSLIWGWVGLLTLLVGCGTKEDKESVVAKKEQIFSQEVKQEEGNKELVKIHFIDTGNSDAILIQEGPQGVLIDGADNDDEKTLPNYIQSQGIEKLIYVVATHPDADHIGGLDAVIQSIEVDHVLVSNGDAETKTYHDFIQALMDKGLSPSVPLVHSTFLFGKGSFEVLSAANEKDPNERSIVLLYTHGEDKVLLMGDAGQEIEKTIQCGKVDLIKLGHHGSSSSSHRDFLQQVAPEAAVLTVGRGNKYGHPHRETMETLEQLQIPVYRTDEGGTLLFESTGKGIRPLQEVNSYLSGSEGVSQKEEVMPQSKSDRVFFTKKGSKYHKMATCSNMKSPIKGTIEEVGKREACQICF